MIVTAREFTSAAEMRAAARAVRAKVFNRPVVKPKPQAKKPVKQIRLVVAGSVLRPQWQLQPLIFDEHIISWRVWMMARAMADLSDGGSGLLGRRTIPQIVNEVLAKFPGVTVDQVRGVTRARPIVEARQAAMHELWKQRKDLSFPAIGRWFGGRDHTTVLHAVRKIEARSEA